MAVSSPVRIADLLDSPAAHEERDGATFEFYDFSASFVTARVERRIGSRTWRLVVNISEADVPRHAHTTIASAVRRAADALTLLNKPRRSTAVDDALSNEVRVILAERGWTFRQAAAECGMELSRLGNLIAGQTRWTVTDMFMIARGIADDPDDEFDRLVEIGRCAYMQST